MTQTSIHAVESDQKIRELTLKEQKKVGRKQPLQMATVDFMSGAVTLERSTKN